MTGWIAFAFRANQTDRVRAAEIGIEETQLEVGRGFSAAGLNHRLSHHATRPEAEAAARDMLDRLRAGAVRRFRGGRASPIPMSTATVQGGATPLTHGSSETRSYRRPSGRGGSCGESCGACSPSGKREGTLRGRARSPSDTIDSLGQVKISRPGRATMRRRDVIQALWQPTRRGHPRHPPRARRPAGDPARSYARRGNRLLRRGGGCRPTTFRAAPYTSAAAREPLRCACHRSPRTGGAQAGLCAPPAQRDARPADGCRQAPIRASGIDHAARQLAEHPDLAVPGRCLTAGELGARVPRRTPVPDAAESRRGQGSRSTKL